VVTEQYATQRSGKELSLMDMLAPRQFAVTMLASSLINRDIARFMGISAHTV